jgi:hypothetical protein
MSSTLKIQKFTFKVFLGINTDKGVGAPLAGPKPVPIPTSCYSFTGLPFLGTKEGRLLIFQQYQFLAGCATVVRCVEVCTEKQNRRRKAQKYENG